MAGRQPGGGSGGEFRFGLVVLLQFDQGEGELGVHPAGDPAAGVQRLAARTPERSAGSSSVWFPAFNWSAHSASQSCRTSAGCPNSSAARTASTRLASSVASSASAVPGSLYGAGTDSA